MEQTTSTTASTATLEIFEYSKDSCSYRTVAVQSPAALSQLPATPGSTVRWLHIYGIFEDTPVIQESGFLEELGRTFSIHPLVIHNIPDQTLRPKVEEYSNLLHLIGKLIYYKEGELQFEHINYLLGADYIITISETRVALFDPIREHIKKHRHQSPRAWCRLPVVPVIGFYGRWLF
ncbi:MAG: CorA family divalent cation transporter [Lachnospiraceae bacterium]